MFLPAFSTAVNITVMQICMMMQKLKSVGGSTQQPLRSIQEPDSLNVIFHTATQPQISAKQTQHVRKVSIANCNWLLRMSQTSLTTPFDFVQAAEAMDSETLLRQLTTVYSAYNTHVRISASCTSCAWK